MAAEIMFMWVLLLWELICSLIGLGKSQHNSSLSIVPRDVPPEPELGPKTSKEYKDLLSVDGKVFEVSTGTWRAEIINEHSLEAGLFVDYEIRFTDKTSTTLELTLTTTMLALSAGEQFFWRWIEWWLANPNREKELYCGGKL